MFFFLEKIFITEHTKFSKQLIVDLLSKCSAGAGTQVPSQASQCGIHGAYSSLDTGFSLCTVSIIQPMPHIHISGHPPYNLTYIILAEDSVIK
jgi:hypothetical protein